MNRLNMKPTLPTRQELELCPYFAQGYRCGYTEASDRVGQYVRGEEWDLADVAAKVNVPGPPNVNRRSWAEGYQVGYRARASGCPMWPTMANAPLPPTGDQ
jgi:hypothetical protein